LREPEDRLATVPDFLVEEVRLDAAAARFVEPDELRDLEPELFEPELFDPELLAEDFTAPRLELREADCLAPERDEPEPERDEDDFAADFLAPDLESELFEPELLAEDLEPDEDFEPEADFEPEDLEPEDLEPEDFEPEDLDADFALVFLAEDFPPDLEADFAAVFLAVVFLAAVFLAPDVEPDLLPEDFEDEVEADFAAVFFAPDFLAPDLPEDFAPDLPLDELRELLFFADRLVLVAPVSPVNNCVSCVSGLDLSSVGIAASFKGLRVQPSRLQGNVVIPSEFRYSESVDSRTHIFSVDTLRGWSASTCRFDAGHHPSEVTQTLYASDTSASFQPHPSWCGVRLKRIVSQILED
jgi:hypothetical protein